MKRRHRAGFVLIQLVWLAYPAIYYVLQADGRYRYPVHWTLLLFAAIALERIRRYIRRSRRGPTEIE